MRSKPKQPPRSLPQFSPSFSSFLRSAQLLDHEVLTGDPGLSTGNLQPTVGHLKAEKQEFQITLSFEPYGTGSIVIPSITFQKGANMENSTTHPRIVAIPHNYPSMPKKSHFVIALVFFGVCSILAGIASFVSAIILLSNGTAPDPMSRMLIEPVYELSLGTFILVCSRTFAKGKFLSIWLYAGSIIIDSLYHMIMGYPLNYLFVGFGLFLIWQIFKFRNELELV